MSFPQFISGASGRLTFFNLNETFDRIEKLERKPPASASREPEKTEIFPARVLAVNGQLGSFIEVSPSATQAGSWSDVPKGIRSTDGTNAYAFPIVDANLAADQVVFLTPANASDGTEIYLVVRSAAPAASTFAAIVTSSAALTGSATARKVWKYGLKRFTATITATNITYTETGAEFFAYNGCENNTDTTSTFGVGLKPDVTPTAPTLVRQAIRTGTIVVVTRESDGTHYFSIPNGYEVTCP